MKIGWVKVRVIELKPDESPLSPEVSCPLIVKSISEHVFAFALTAPQVKVKPVIFICDEFNNTAPVVVFDGQVSVLEVPEINTIDEVAESQLMAR